MPPQGNLPHAGLWTRLGFIRRYSYNMDVPIFNRRQRKSVTLFTAKCP